MIRAISPARGATEQQAIDGARANMADYEGQQGVDCVEESAFSQWNWEYEYWEGTVHAVCDFGS